MTGTHPPWHRQTMNLHHIFHKLDQLIDIGLRQQIRWSVIRIAMQMRGEFTLRRQLLQALKTCVSNSVNVLESSSANLS
jgi:hypothetical protein